MAALCAEGPERMCTFGQERAELDQRVARILDRLGKCGLERELELDHRERASDLAELCADLAVLGRAFAGAVRFLEQLLLLSAQAIARGGIESAGEPLGKS